MSLLNAKTNLNSLLRTVGKINLNANYPDEFELYLFAFELLDYKGQTLQYFIFPDNPRAVRESQPTLSTVQKTMTGVVVLNNPTFVPVDITLNGTFGRRLRILVGKDSVVLASQFINTQIQQLANNPLATSNSTNGSKVFDTQIKTGYGCTKILEKILKGASQLDNGNPRTLIFYNLALGNSYVVEIVSAPSFEMTEESNMMWQYNVTLKGVAPADNFISFDSKHFNSVQQQLAVNQFAQERVNGAISFINKFVNTEDIYRDARLFDTPEAQSVLNSIGISSNRFSGVFQQSNVFSDGSILSNTPTIP